MHFNLHVSLHANMRLDLHLNTHLNPHRDLHFIVAPTLQFNLQLLGEVLCCTNAGVFRSKGEHLLPWIEDICSCLDKTLNTTQKDE